jgi:DNA-directed RNA polymerase sigma subunit (sigma70/sigma32)
LQPRGYTKAPSLVVRVGYATATVGRKLGITREGARQLEREALRKLERALDDRAR